MIQLMKSRQFKLKQPQECFAFPCAMPSAMPFLWLGHVPHLLLILRSALAQSTQLCNAHKHVVSSLTNVIVPQLLTTMFKPKTMNTFLSLSLSVHAACIAIHCGTLPYKIAEVEKYCNILRQCIWQTNSVSDSFLCLNKHL